jgi:hypothetical protein
MTTFAVVDCPGLQSARGDVYVYDWKYALEELIQSKKSTYTTLKF